MGAFNMPSRKLNDKSAKGRFSGMVGVEGMVVGVVGVLGALGVAGVGRTASTEAHWRSGLLEGLLDDCFLALTKRPVLSSLKA